MNFSWFSNWQFDRQLRTVFPHVQSGAPVGNDRGTIIGESAGCLHGKYRLPVSGL
ncbi:hypothetical protein [Pseudomonas sp. H9]|uniref:hypothetical protein n=1 Tax=Pseudomonas sp. H9 TaxID=483968 RepID=UPI001404E132|nr:hypothetical protein [Pseudomonas sp. H9]